MDRSERFLVAGGRLRDGALGCRFWFMADCRCGRCGLDGGLDGGLEVGGVLCGDPF